jgi:transposase
VQLRRFAGMGCRARCQALRRQLSRHARAEKCAGDAQTGRWHTAWRNAPETAWLADSPSSARHRAMRRLDAGYTGFFEAVKAGQRAGPPSFKRCGEESGMRFPDPKQLSLDAAIEGLPTTGMSASGRGAVDEPGRNVKATPGQTRNILGAARGEFFRRLVHSLQWRGGRVVVVDRAHTGHTCRISGLMCEPNRKAPALIRRVARSNAEHADVHAGKNILAERQAIWLKKRSAACGAGARCEALARVCRGAAAKRKSAVARALA